MDIRNRKLIKNTAILSFGTFSTKILSFILIPIYSHYLTPEAFGQVDIILTVLSILYVVVSLQSIESSFRFIQDCDNDKSRVKVVTNSFFISAIGIVIYEIVLFIITIYFSLDHYLIFSIYVPISITSFLLLHTIRGMNKTSSFVVSNVLATIVAASSNIVLIVYFRQGAMSLLIAPIISNTCIIIFVTLYHKFWRYIKIKSLDMNEVKKHLKFSLPLIPNAVSLWLLASVGRFVILYYYGNEATGLLAFTLKFPLLLGTIAATFHMAWQINAVDNFNNKGDSDYLSKVFNNYLTILLSVLIIILPATKILILTIMGKAYVSTWIYVPLFMIAIVFKYNASFYNANYYALKKTKIVFTSTVIAALIYLVLSIILAKKLYITGIGISYVIAEIMHWYYLILKSPKDSKIYIDYRKITPTLIVLFISLIIYYVDLNIVWQIVNVMILVIIVIYLERNIVKSTLAHLKQKLFL